MNKLLAMPAVRLRNALLLSGFAVISVILSAAYLLEFIKGNRSEAYVIAYVLILFVMMVAYSIAFVFMQDTETRFAYFTFTLYCVFHLFTMITSRLSYYEMYEIADKEMYDRKEEMKNG